MAIWTACAAQARPVVAVIPFQASGVSAADAHGLTVLFEAALQKTGRFTVIGQTRMQALLAAQDISLADCTDETCAADIGRLVAAEQIVLGNAGKVGQRYYLMVRLIDVTRGTNLSTQDAQKPSLDEIVDDLAALASLLARQASGQSPAPTTLEMVLVAGGSFEMGDTFDEGATDERPVHLVTVPDFMIARYEVTVGQFRQFVQEVGYRTTAERVGANSVFVGSTWGWEQKSDASWRNPYFEQTDRQPAVLVSWYDAAEYCNWLSRKEGLPEFYGVRGTAVSMDWSANGYRLPTEAEWEYAARSGGKANKYSWGNRSPAGNVADETVRQQLKDRLVVIFDGYSDGYFYTAPVGSYRANELDLFDMSGNVWEWCNDWYGAYIGSAQADPRGPETGSDRILRGGAWCYPAKTARAAERGGSAPGVAGNTVGFRPARRP